MLSDLIGAANIPATLKKTCRLFLASNQRLVVHSSSKDFPNFVGSTARAKTRPFQMQTQ